MCPEHEMEKVNMYCEVCRRPVCHLCKLGGSHANHKVTSMSSAYKILKVCIIHSLSLFICPCSEELINSIFYFIMFSEVFYGNLCLPQN